MTSKSSRLRWEFRINEAGVLAMQNEEKDKRKKGAEEKRSQRRVPLFSFSPLLLFVLASSGCSTAPIADFLDHFFPAKPPANAGPGRGGVCSPASLGTGGALSPNALPPDGAPPPLSPVAPPLGAVVAPGPVSMGPGNSGAPNLPTIDPPAFPLMSAPPSPGGADAKPLPNPPPQTPPPF